MLSVARKRRIKLAWRIGSRRAAFFDTDFSNCSCSTKQWFLYKELKAAEDSLGYDTTLIRNAYNRAFESY